ncbi:MAG TPA: hypothetical protein VGK19_16550 [Capsulimonadaceae bacterium]|jgi:hypothetical protein
MTNENDQRSGVIDTPDEAVTKVSPLPPLKRLAGAVLTACAPIFGVAFVIGHLRFGYGVLAGAGICIALYSLLRVFVTGGMDLMAADIEGVAQGGSTSFAKAKFAAVLVGKFFVISALMFLLLKVWHADIAGFSVGFLVSQATITYLATTYIQKRSS